MEKNLTTWKQLKPQTKCEMKRRNAFRQGLELIKGAVKSLIILSFYCNISFAHEKSIALNWYDSGKKFKKQWDYSVKDPDNILEHFNGRFGDKIVRIALADLGFSKPVLIVQKLDNGSCGYPTFFLFDHRQIFNVCTENVDIGKKRNNGINDLLLSDGRGTAIWKWGGKSWIFLEKVN